MRLLEESRSRWQVTTEHVTSLEDFKKSVKLDGDNNPCIAGLRSVCWKTFLLFQNTEVTGWPRALVDSRSAYTSLREHLLRFTENSDELGSSLDPLDDNQNSPWNTLRQDEEIRAEIFQDVERCMPEEPYFRRPETQRMLLDILFVFCKINQDVGYRQGMHELLAPVLWVVEQDAIDLGNITQRASGLELDQFMEHILDRAYIEHDAFTLLSLIMRSAKSFYELGEPDRRASTPSTGPGTPQHGASPIVERSKRIHEVYLARLDPELAKHLTDIEVLPQIFLIRWIRLLFGREFPFDDLLTLWDTLLAEDPGLDLVDMVCVAMLLRIRWQLLEANYSFALMLLLKYPSPKSPNGPKSFVDDATFLRKNFSAAGGSSIIEKYSGKSPSAQPSSSRPSAPIGHAFSPKLKLSRTKSPLPPPARFLQQQGGVGDLFQGAAKGLFDRGERLGINQAVRDAVEEAKKNMQGLQASRSNSTKGRTPSDITRWSLDKGRSIPTTRSSVSAVNARNRQLAGMLDQAMSDLRAVSLSKDEDRDTYIKAMDLAIAKVEFVKVYLEDSSMPLPSDPSSGSPPLATSPQTSPSNPLPVAPPKAPKTSTPKQKIGTSTSLEMDNPPPTQISNTPEAHSAKVQEVVPPLTVQQIGTEPRADKGLLTRPTAPLPTRSSIAQSNFAWMLEPDLSSGSTPKASPPKPSSPFLKSGRRPITGASREKAAFLFGDDGGESSTSSPRLPVVTDADEGFNMGTLKRGLKPNQRVEEEG